MKNSYFLLACLLAFILNAGFSQSPPPCDGSFINLLQYTESPSGARLTIAVSPSEGTTAYNLLHQFTLNGILQSQIFPMNPPETTIAIFPADTLHQFTSINVCSNGESHIGSTFFLDLGNNSLDCPAITNLTIDQLTPALINFSWEAAPEAISFRIRYEASNGFSTAFETEVSSVEQILQRTTRHTFFITPQCQDPAVRSAIPGPTFSFTIVIVDDIKAAPRCEEALRDSVENAYLVLCTKHGDFGPNLSRFVNFHIEELMLMGCATPAAEQKTLVSYWSFSPNPAAEAIEVSYELAEVAQIEIKLLNLQGQTLAQVIPSSRQSAGTYRQEFPLKNLPAGIYLLRLRAEQQVLSKKLIVFPH